jgi:hypothetical protein
MVLIQGNINNVILASICCLFHFATLNTGGVGQEQIAEGAEKPEFNIKQCVSKKY